METSDLTNLVNKYFDEFRIEETDVPDHKLVIDLVTKDRTLLYIKPIRGQPALYNNSISKKTFGPELIHEDDFKRSQLLMSQKGAKQCMYIIYSTDLKVLTFQFIFPLDKHFIAWSSED
jgi:hypothetical protein